MQNNSNMTQDFSLWCDFIERRFLEQDFGALIDAARFVGATSNPSIFANAITNSSAYTEDIARLRTKPNITPKVLYETLAIEDIKQAAKLLHKLYVANKDYGLISIEIDPFLSDDIEASIAEGRRLYESIGYENVMIKVPATKAGYEVMGTLFREGIHINATLVFSQQQARECAQILDCNAKTDARAVISVFVSRFDGLLPPLKDSKPQLGILNAMACYDEIESLQNPRIRTLFASTGAKLKGLPKDYYITNLVASHSVNTAPLETILAFLQEPKERTIEWLSGKEALRAIHHIDLGNYTLESMQHKLFSDGVAAFKEAFGNLLASLSS